jgi:hypothetical protein
MKTYFVFDVESVGLHGEGFAVGIVVINEDQEILCEYLLVCPMPHAKRISDHDAEWCRSNIPPMIATHVWPRAIRAEFMRIWSNWKEDGATMVADCNWPVEARFLNQCVDDNPIDMAMLGPYPFIDLGSILLAKGMDPLTEFPRLKSEMPKHNPLNDARQSARILISFLHPHGA